MSAALASIGPIGWAAIAAGSFIAWSISRGKRVLRALLEFDDAQDDDTVLASYPPPVPPLSAPMDDGGWDEWVRVWPADTALEVMEQAVFDRLFAEIPEVAADLRDHA